MHEDIKLHQTKLKTMNIFCLICRLFILFRCKNVYAHRYMLTHVPTCMHPHNTCTHTHMYMCTCPHNRHIHDVKGQVRLDERTVLVARKGRGKT